MRKLDRDAIRAKFGGRCAYCGCMLGDRWHVDHVEPVHRELRYESGKGVVATGRMYRPENDRPDNLFPACPPCNIDKHAMPLEAWRQKLSRTCAVLARNSSTYRHGVRFGLIKETGSKITFYFERHTPPDHVHGREGGND